MNVYGAKILLYFLVAQVLKRLVEEPGHEFGERSNRRKGIVPVDDATICGGAVVIVAVFAQPLFDGTTKSTMEFGIAQSFWLVRIRQEFERQTQSKGLVDGWIIFENVRQGLANDGYLVRSAGIGPSLDPTVAHMNTAMGVLLSDPFHGNYRAFFQVGSAIDVTIDSFDKVRRETVVVVLSRRHNHHGVSHGCMLLPLKLLLHV